MFENMHIISTAQKAKLSLGIHRELVPGSPCISKSTDAQVPYIKWGRSMHTVSPLHLWTPSHGLKIVLVFIGKTSVCKWMLTVQIILFKDQLHIKEASLFFRLNFSVHTLYN